MGKQGIWDPYNTMAILHLNFYFSILTIWQQAHKKCHVEKTKQLIALKRVITLQLYNNHNICEKSHMPCFPVDGHIYINNTNNVQNQPLY